MRLGIIAHPVLPLLGQINCVVEFWRWGSYADSLRSTEIRNLKALILAVRRGIITLEESSVVLSLLGIVIKCEKKLIQV